MTKELKPFYRTEQAESMVLYKAVNGFIGNWFPFPQGDGRLPEAKENRGGYFLYNNNKYLGDTLNDHHFL